MRSTIRICLAPQFAILSLGGPGGHSWRLLSVYRWMNAEAALFRACTGRAELPAAAFGFIWLVIGRRGGKSFCMAILAAFLAGFHDWQRYLSPGERAVVLLVAADREQAKILIRYIQGILATPLLSQLVENVTADTIDLKGSVTIEVVTRSYRSVRGRSVCVALLDELAFWRDAESANPDREVLNAIRASMATFGDDAMVIAGSSPYARNGVLWDAYKQFHGRDNPQNLVWQAATRVMNPSIGQGFVDKEYERDPASAAAEYGAEFRSDIAEFVALDVLEACTARGVYEISPLAHERYFAFVDPSGGSSDSMTLAISHREEDIAILDCVREIRAPFAPESVVDEFAALMKSYGLSSVVGDRYAGEWPREQFHKRGIVYEPADRPKSDLYRDMLPLLNSGRVQLLDNQRLISQLHGLERRTARGGKDSIDHPPRGHDDVANAVAGALVLAQDNLRRGGLCFPGLTQTEDGGCIYEPLPNLEPIKSNTFRVGEVKTYDGSVW
ncbi:hypothetical protein RZS28_00635 [Methylocapsa polymorpha]|uniref:Terminase n=1 Tax=Methylocapsa polymorpha TaxID=3080828 RepID=A0ABZ0HSS1_9HYPH|nr:hypothetical protein RZS28_00635 [Methylocapsa sp. RX1]